MRNFFESTYPYFLGIVVFLVFIWKGADALIFASGKQWEIGSLYGSVFDLCSVLAAFLFAFFTFVRAAETEFIRKIKKTIIFQRFLKNLRTAIYFAAACTLITVPFLVVEPTSSDIGSVSFWLIGTWLSLSVSTFALSYRSVSQFVTLSMAGTEYE